MARIRHSAAYDRLAVLAGERAGLKNSTPAEITKSPEAVAVRMELWAEYEQMLRDSQTFTLEAVVSWLAEQGCKASRSAVARDRNALLSRERSIVTAASRARAVMEMVDKEANGGADIFEAGRTKAGQLIFEALCEIGPDALADLKPNSILTMVRTLAELGQSDAQTRLLKQKVAEMQRAFDEAAAAAQQQSRDSGHAGDITPEQLELIRRRAFGGAA